MEEASEPASPEAAGGLPLGPILGALAIAAAGAVALRAPAPPPPPPATPSAPPPAPATPEPTLPPSAPPTTSPTPEPPEPSPGPPEPTPDLFRPRELPPDRVALTAPGEEAAARRAAALGALQGGSQDDLLTAVKELRAVTGLEPTWSEGWATRAAAEYLLALRMEVLDRSPTELLTSSREAAEQGVSFAESDIPKDFRRGNLTRGAALGRAVLAAHLVRERNLVDAGKQLARIESHLKGGPLSLMMALGEPTGVLGTRGQGHLSAAIEDGFGVLAQLLTARAWLARARDEGDTERRAALTGLAEIAARDARDLAPEALAPWLVLLEALHLRGAPESEQLEVVVRALGVLRGSGVLWAHKASVEILALDGQAGSPRKRARVAWKAKRSIENAEKAGAQEEPATRFARALLAELEGTPLGEVQGALGEVHRAAPWSARYRDVYRTRLQRSSSTGDRAAALALARDEARSRPHDVIVRSRLADLLLAEAESVAASGDTTAAALAFRRVVAEGANPGLSAVRRAHERLKELTRQPAEVKISVADGKRTVVTKTPEKTVKEIFDHRTGKLLKRWVWEK